MSNLNWNALFANGSIIDLETKKWGANTKLKPSDLGVDDTEAVKQALSLGRVRLMPANSFRAVNQAIRDAKNAIEDASINFGMIRGARYIPDKNMETLRPKLIAAKNDFFEAIDQFCNTYQAQREKQLPIIRQALESSGASKDTISNAFKRVNAAYPTVTEVRAKFLLTWDVYTIQGAKSRAALAAVTEETGRIQSVVSGMVNELRTEVQKTVAQLLKAAAKGGKLRKNTLESSYKMIERLETLNVLGDTVLAQQLQGLKATFAQMDKNQMDDIFIAGLEEVKTELEESGEAAIREVEANLTGVGRRKFASSKDEARA